jgi:hypothetical protein
MTEEQRDEALDEIAKIDAMFETAACYSCSWSIATKRRDSLIDQLHEAGYPIPHKYRARLSDESRTD